MSELKTEPALVLSPEAPSRPAAAAPTTAAPARRPIGANHRRGARLHEANRAQLCWGRIDLDAQLPEDHPARAICAVIERLDLGSLYAQIEARDEVAGAPAIDPQILLSLWVYATSEGEGSAREIWRLTQVHAAYRWICGGVEVSYHTLSDFRSQQGPVVGELITQVLALLMKQDLVDLTRVAQDGTRVRASAGAASFRREQTLGALMQQAREHLGAITREASDPAISARRAAARQRGARERLARLEAALAQVPQVTETKKRSGAKDATVRVSTTDPDARVMKMGDGGFRPAFNLQFATTTDEARVIVGVTATNRGTDQGEAAPMLDQIEQRTGRRPREILVDGGYAGHDSVDAVAEAGTTLYAPLPKPKKGDTRPTCRGPTTARPWPTGDSAWRPMRPRRSTSSARRLRRPSTQTPRRTAGSTASPFEVYPRSWGRRVCSPSPTTCSASSPSLGRTAQAPARAARRRPAGARLSVPLSLATASDPAPPRSTAARRTTRPSTPEPAHRHRDAGCRFLLTL